MFENPRRGRQARNFTTNVSKILDLKSSSEQIFVRKLSLGAPVNKQTKHFCLSYIPQSEKTNQPFVSHSDGDFLVFSLVYVSNVESFW